MTTRVMPVGLTVLAIVATGCGRDEGAVAGAGSPPAVEAVSDTDGDDAAPAEDTTPFEKRALAPTESHPFSARDLLDMDRIGATSLSPDGQRVAYVLRQTDLEGDRGRTDLYVSSLAEGSEPQRVTTHPSSDGDPVFSPDGEQLYFLSSRSGSQQVWRMGFDGAPPEAVTELPLDVGTFRLSPDGKRLALTLDVFVDCEDLACTKDRLESIEADPRTGQAYDGLFVRHWDSWKDGRRGHLFVHDLEADTTVDVTAGLDADVPSRPFGGNEDYAFSHDGQHLVYAARVAGGEEPWSTNFDLFAVPITGGEARNLTADNPAWDAHPVFSPDGETLAYVAMKRAGFEADRFRVVLQPWPEGEARVLTEDWDRSAGGLAFSPDGETLFATAQDTGQTPIFGIDVATGAVTTVLGEGTHGHLAVGPGPDDGPARLVFTRNDLGHPDELYVADAKGESSRALTHHNDARLERAARGEFEQFSFTGAGGDTVYGWVVKPADFDQSERHPVAFLIHGGPQGSFGNRFHYRWNPQTYAGAGYAVIMIDFHGSTGYGQDFTDAISGDWGGKPLEDLKKGLAAATERYPWLDDDRVCALGASYGGYMINWIAGQWPERFDCLVNHDGIFDNRSMYYATEELWFPEWEHGGPYWQNPQGYEKHNPARFVDRWKTPMLVIHGSKDHRVPVEQGLATFTALQRRGIESRLLHFPDENHWVLRPNNSLQWHEEVLRWLDAHLRPDAVRG